MGTTFTTTLRWAGRALVLLAAYVTVAALFFPAGIAPLEPMVCPEGTTLDNERYRSTFARDDSKLEVVCTSPDQTESAFGPLALVVASLVALGLAASYVAQRRSDPRYQAPTGR
jgi:hypothetical protein